MPEKLEALAVGPQLQDGSFPLLVLSDNDYSVTQTGANVQNDIVSNGVSAIEIPLSSVPPAGYALLPSFAFSVRSPAGQLDLTDLFDFDSASYVYTVRGEPGAAPRGRDGGGGGG